MRAWIAAAVVAVLADVGWAAPTMTVDLDSPGALARLKHAEPDEYAKVLSIMRCAGSVDFDRMVKVRYGGSGGFRSPIVLTSFPPQRDFSFTLGGRTYHGRVGGLRMQAELLRAGELPRGSVPRAEADAEMQRLDKQRRAAIRAYDEAYTALALDTPERTPTSEELETANRAWKAYVSVRQRIEESGSRRMRKSIDADC